MFLLENSHYYAPPVLGELPHLLRWLRTKPAQQRYSYCAGGAPLLEAYLREHQARGRWKNERLHVQTRAGFEWPLSWEFYFIAGDHPRTYASAIRRARNFIAEKTP